MKTLIIPQFDIDLKFTSYTEVKVHNKMNNEEFNMVLGKLPGITQGDATAIHFVSPTNPIELTRLYDIRQGSGVKKLKNFYIALKQ